MSDLGKTVPTGELWAGSPARFLRSLSEVERQGISTSAQRYVELAKHYREQYPVIYSRSDLA
jgi:gamma-carbonic anhydrase